MIDDTLRLIKESGEFEEIDWHFARFISNLDGSDNELLMVLSALTSRATREGNICIHLDKFADKNIFSDKETLFTLPDLDSLKQSLASSEHVGIPSEYKPLILDSNNHLYLYRYWLYENILAEKINRLASETITDINIETFKASINRLFPAPSSDDFDYQKLAAFTAVSKKICVITGGPGTGKTTTVAGIIALLIEQNDSIKIALAAPTGKAAARLQESIQNSVENINCDKTIRDLIPKQASTVHRLLGSIRNSPYFRFNKDNRLPHDLVIVDEASMVDLPLLSKLVQALDDNSRLILIGDKDQLASVEAGAALGDICNLVSHTSPTVLFAESFTKITGLTLPGNSNPPLNSKLGDCIVELRKSYRFGESSGIGVISRAVNESQIESAVNVLNENNYPDLNWSGLPPVNKLHSQLNEKVFKQYSNYLSTNDPLKALSQFGEFQILCAVREGPYGVVYINQVIEHILSKAGKINTDSKWYCGRPVIIQRNDYQLGLYNGDIGIALPDDINPDILKVYFPAQDGLVRKFSPIRLPAHETVFAMTIHKSQGSEFQNVLVILPDSQSPILTRELLYTGITRAKSHLDIWCNIDVMRYTAGKQMSRESGLLEKLLDTKKPLE